MARHPFPGFPAFLDAAAAQVGRPEAAGPARRIAALAAAANLCAQAAEAPEGHVEGILARAGDFRDQLLAAHRAAELMIADVRAGRGPAATDRPKTTPEPKRYAEASPPSA